MNLRGLVNTITRAVNANVTATILRNAGADSKPGGIRIPRYGKFPITVQVQALSYSDLQQLEGLNIQGTRRAVYLDGAAFSLVRVAQKGGDLLIFERGLLPEGTTWLVVHVLEQWQDGRSGAAWAKVAITLQDESKVDLASTPSLDFSSPDNSQNLPGI
jgi:hypothetical protein